MDESSLNQNVQITIEELVDIKVKIKECERLKEENKRLLIQTKKDKEKINELENDIDSIKKDYQHILSFAPPKKDSEEENPINNLNVTFSEGSEENGQIVKYGKGSKRCCSFVEKGDIRRYLEIIRKIDLSEQYTFSTNDVRKKQDDVPLVINYNNFVEVFTEIVKKRVDVKSIDGKVSVPSKVMLKEYCIKHNLNNILYESDDVNLKNKVRININNISKIIEKIENERAKIGKDKLFRVVTYRFPYFQFQL